METVTLTTNKTLAAGAVLGGFFGTFLTVLMIFYVLLIIANWKIFTKAGESGWKSIIPVYNSYIMFKIAGIKNWFWITIVSSLIMGIVPSIAGQTSTVSMILSFVCGIVFFIADIMLCNKMAKAFGKGIGYTLGLIFLPSIFTLILGFGKAEYVGTENN